MAAVEISFEGDDLKDVVNGIEDVPEQYQTALFNELDRRFQIMIGEIEDSAPEVGDIKYTMSMQDGTFTMTMSFGMPGVAVAQQVFGSELSVPSNPVQPIFVGKESNLPFSKGVIRFSNDSPLYQPIMSALSRFFAGIEDEMGLDKEQEGD
jgi:hypothetical protein